MSKIQSKLDSLQPYIVGIRYVQGMQVVDAVFKTGWTVPESDVIRKELVEEENNYYMFYTDKEGITFDDLLEYVEGIITINIEREKKHELLKNKVKELQEIFKKNTLSKLETLKFRFNEPELVPSLGDMDIDLDEELETPVQPIKETPTQPIKEAPVETFVEQKTNVTTTTVKGQQIELPPRDEKIVVEDYEAPTNIVCKCGPDDVCPVCEEEKFG